MKTINVREFRNAIPHLRETLMQEQELLLVSHGEPIARILPVNPTVVRPRLESLQWLRDKAGGIQPESTMDIRAERDLR